MFPYEVLDFHLALCWFDFLNFYNTHKHTRPPPAVSSQPCSSTQLPRRKQNTRVHTHARVRGDMRSSSHCSSLFPRLSGLVQVGRLESGGRLNLSTPLTIIVWQQTYRVKHNFGSSQRPQLGLTDPTWHRGGQRNRVGKLQSSADLAPDWGQGAIRDGDGLMDVWGFGESCAARLLSGSRCVARTKHTTSKTPESSVSLQVHVWYFIYLCSIVWREWRCKSTNKWRLHYMRWLEPQPLQSEWQGAADKNVPLNSQQLWKKKKLFALWLRKI